MTRYVQSQLLQYEANPNFWMRDENGGRLPRLRGQTTLIVSDLNAAYLKFLAGQLDIYTPRPEEIVSLKENAKQLNITVTSTGVDTGELFFSFNRNPQSLHRQWTSRSEARLVYRCQFSARDGACDRQAGHDQSLLPWTRGPRLRNHLAGQQTFL